MNLSNPHQLPSFNLAIETSGLVGSVSLGKGSQLLATIDMPPQQRHRVDLMPTIDQLTRQHGLLPNQLREIYVSIGPGSFTGLRIALATAQMLALTLDCSIVAVPTLHALACNAPQPDAGANSPELLVGLNMKKDTVYAGRFTWQSSGWQPADAPSLRTMTQALESASRPLWVLGDPLPDRSAWEPLSGITALPVELAQPRSQAVWQLGRQLAQEGRFTPPTQLLPLYAREPEAKTLWDQRHG